MCFTFCTGKEFFPIQTLIFDLTVFFSCPQWRYRSAFALQKSFSSRRCELERSVRVIPNWARVGTSLHWNRSLLAILPSFIFYLFKSPLQTLLSFCVALYLKSFQFSILIIIKQNKISKESFNKRSSGSQHYFIFDLVC